MDLNNKYNYENAIYHEFSLYNILHVEMPKNELLFIK